MTTPTAVKEDEYILNRDWRAMARLNQRHHLFKLAQGYLLHPSVTLVADAKIAEIGAGTWLYVVDGAVARAAFLGNINLIAHDVYQPVPTHMIGVYDLVHVQNWLCIWRDETSETLITNLMVLLKPGGYLQWSEQDPTANKIIRAPGSQMSTTATQEILGFLNKPRESINFHFDRLEIVKAHQTYWSISVLQGCEEFSSNLQRRAKTKSDIEKAEELRNATERASAELLNGVGIHQELVIAVAQNSFT